MNRVSEAERVSKVEEVIMTLRNALFLFFCYAGLREIWLSKILAPIDGKAQIVFYVIMALFGIVGTASLPIEVKVGYSEGTLYYQTNKKWMLSLAFALIGIVEVLAALEL